uniref:Uncharacterized protein n=1 Tax=Globodera rostochiensis TaxID=31243 RepID=A0A914H4X0_GLORO
MVILFILMISSATLEAQQNDKFFDLMTTIGEYFRGEFNETEKAILNLFLFLCCSEILEQNWNRTGTEQEQNRNRTGTELEQNRNRT